MQVGVVQKSEEVSPCKVKHKTMQVLIGSLGSRTAFRQRHSNGLRGLGAGRRVCRRGPAPASQSCDVVCKDVLLSRDSHWGFRAWLGDMPACPNEVTAHFQMGETLEQ